MQSPRSILMIRPKHFAFDEETAASNHFQQRLDKNCNDIQADAVKEFDEAVRKLQDAGVDVSVFDDRDHPICPDAVFPNNWISSHDNGLVIVYPMEGESRRRERRQDIIDFFEKCCSESGKTFELLDLSHHSETGQFLEGTGSIVFDYVARRAFACLSSRTHEEILKLVCDKVHFEPVIFRAKDRHGMDIYHTNVVMWIGTKVAVVCEEAITDKKDCMVVMNLLQSSDRVVVPISLDEMEHFAGNCYEVMVDEDKCVLIISQAARRFLSSDTFGLIESIYGEESLVVCNVATIEAVGGGSIRCMMAGNFIV